MNLQNFLVTFINLLSKSKMGSEGHLFRESIILMAASDIFCLKVLKQNYSHYDYIRREMTL